MVFLSRGQEAIEAARAFQEAGRILVEEGPTDDRKTRWLQLEARAWLIEGQLRLMAGDPVKALTVFAQASTRYQALLERGDATAGQTLLRIGRILESRGRPDGAAHHYRLVFRSLMTDRLGAEALLRLAMVYRDKLDQPMKAIETLQRYHDLYPPVFRVPSSARDRIVRLGYSDVQSFQAAQGLKVDGVLGQKTLAALRAEEENFKEILPGPDPAVGIRGKMVHETMFKIARQLEERGRFREAARAWQVFLSMYPGNRLADDALLGLARMFRQLDLFHEAVAAYSRLMEDYPKGDQTSHAYIEAAYCYEGLSEWKKAEELYDLYLRKFPRYNRVPQARRNLAALRKLIRYADLVEEGRLQPARMADARYEMGRLLYKDIENRQKAVEVFTEVADRYPETYQGPDARYTAGVCLLHEENFERARREFGRLVEAWPDSRLADDALFWIGHTYEYQARALGELDEDIIVLKKRSAAEGDRLRDDLDLRRAFWSEAKAGAVAWHEPHPDVLTDGRKHDKVREGIQAAIEAYQKVGEK
ncbi:MAG: tetratricopeptide repeat protein, partial [Verrucomicrobiota bacterium]